MDKAVLEDSCRAPNGEVIIQFDKPGAWANTNKSYRGQSRGPNFNFQEGERAQWTVPTRVGLAKTNCRCCDATDIRERSKMSPLEHHQDRRSEGTAFRQSNGGGAAFTRYGHYKMSENGNVYSGWWTNAVPEQVVQSRCWLSKGTTPSSNQGLDTCTFGNCSSRCLSRSYSKSMCCTGLS